MLLVEKDTRPDRPRVTLEAKVQDNVPIWKFIIKEPGKKLNKVLALSPNRALNILFNKYKNTTVEEKITESAVLLLFRMHDKLKAN